MSLNNPYYYHPQLATQLVADDVLSYISHHSAWSQLFEQGKMLGVAIVEKPSDDVLADHTALARVHYINNTYYLVAYSGVVNGLNDDEGYFTPPIYDLQNPDDFYLQKDQAITEINRQISSLEIQKTQTPTIKAQIQSLRQQRKELSLGLQQEIFSHFNFVDKDERYKNVVEIFAEAKRGLPPGGAGECAAPRLLQYANLHHLKPLALAEFWYGKSPRKIQRIHGQFYPSCIEKCSPILSFMTKAPKAPQPASNGKTCRPDILFEDQDVIVLVKPKGLLSVPSKDTNEANVETILHETHPDTKGPMLVHRLDQATSGLMLAAKNAQAHKALQQQFEAKTIHKRYTARLRGRVKAASGILSLPLTVNPDDRPRQVVDWQFGKTAVTYFELISQDAESSLLALYPQTGRTHQLRVHCASPYGLDMPILGDDLYDIMDEEAPKKEKCLQLHAESITFVHPTTGQTMTFTQSAE